MLTDGAGVPLSVAVDGANRHDSKLLVATLDGLVVARPAPGEEEEEGAAHSEEQHLCLDAAYDSEEVRQELEARSYEPHISPADKDKRSERKEARRHPGRRARRWVVERTHSWLNRSRRLLVRWEKKIENYLAFIQLACAQLIFSKILVSG
jgi:putative transposase